MNCRRARPAEPTVTSCSVWPTRRSVLCGLSVGRRGHQRGCPIGTGLCCSKSSTARVVARDQNVVALTFAARNGGLLLPRWHPGAHLDIHLPSGRVRQYSLCGDPASRDTYHIAVRRIPDGGGGSIEMHALSVGSQVVTNGPPGSFRWLFRLRIAGSVSGSSRVGIGITPILPMLDLAVRLGIEWSMIYVGRSAELSRSSTSWSATAIESRCGRMTSTGCLPRASPGRVSGRHHRLRVRAGGDDDDPHAARGRGDVELHFQSDSPPPPVVDGTEFTVTVASSEALHRRRG